MKIAFHADAERDGGSLVLGLFKDEAPDCLAGIAGFSLALARRAIAASRFTGSIGQHLNLSGSESGGFDRVVLAGLGARDACTPLLCEKIGGHLATHLHALGEKQACVHLREAALSRSEQAARMAFGAQLASYRFHRYRSRLRPGEATSLESLAFVLPDCGKASALSAELDHLATAIGAARDLVNEPPNVLDPATFAQACKTLAPLGVEVESMDEAELEARGFHALLAVGRGSAKESRLVTLQWRGGASAQSPLAFVGK
ncbi:MAG TPA: M17 family peptidase N-terminal domain-containing protein, partial [Rhizomicrobium sp.]